MDKFVRKKLPGEPKRALRTIFVHYSVQATQIIVQKDRTLRPQSQYDFFYGITEKMISRAALSDQIQQLVRIMNKHAGETSGFLKQALVRRPRCGQSVADQHG